MELESKREESLIAKLALDLGAVNERLRDMGAHGFIILAGNHN